MSVNDSIASAIKAKEFPITPAVPFIITRRMLTIIPIIVVLPPILPASSAVYSLLIVISVLT